MTAWVFVLIVWPGMNYSMSVSNIATSEECVNLGRQITASMPGSVDGKFNCFGYRARVK